MAIAQDLRMLNDALVLENKKSTSLRGIVSMRCIFRTSNAGSNCISAHIVAQALPQVHRENRGEYEVDCGNENTHGLGPNNRATNR